MFDELTKKHLNANPFVIIDGDVYKYCGVVYVENNTQYANFKSILGSKNRHVSYVELDHVEISPTITAIGRLYEMTAELKSMIEISQIK